MKKTRTGVLRYRLRRAWIQFTRPILVGPRDACFFPEDDGRVADMSRCRHLSFPRKVRLRIRNAWRELVRPLHEVESDPVGFSHTLSRRVK